MRTSTTPGPAAVVDGRHPPGRLVDVLDGPLAKAGRHIHCAELFSGVGSVANAARQRSLNAVEFDQARLLGVTNVGGAASEDLLTEQGFWSAVRCVLSK